MTKTIRLNDLQLVLLSNAAARENGSLIPLPDNCTHDRSRIGKAVAALLRRSLIEEIPVTDRSLTWREQDQQALGLFITGAGRAAIGAEPEHVGQDDAGGEPESTHVAGKAAVQADTGQLASPETDVPAPASVAPRASSKIAAVVALLGRAEGATLDEIVEATGWLPHTTRAALTGLRKKGRAIAKTRRGDVTCYRIEAKVAA